MSQCNRSSLLMPLDCGLHSVEDATASQLDLLISTLGRQGHALPEFSFKNDIMVGLCATWAQWQPKYITALNDVECILEFEEGTEMVGVKKSLEQTENWLGIPVQVYCTMPRPEQLKTLHHRTNYSDSTLTAPETWEEVRSQIERA